LANAKTAFTFLSDKVYDHTTGEEEKEPRLWQALGEQDFRANKFDNLLRCQNEKLEAMELGWLSRQLSWNACRLKLLGDAGRIAGVPP